MLIALTSCYTSLCWLPNRRRSGRREDVTGRANANHGPRSADHCLLASQPPPRYRWCRKGVLLIRTMGRAGWGVWSNVLDMQVLAGSGRMRCRRRRQLVWLSAFWIGGSHLSGLRTSEIHIDRACIFCEKPDQRLTSNVALTPRTPRTYAHIRESKPLAVSRAVRTNAHKHPTNRPIPMCSNIQANRQFAEPQHSTTGPVQVRYRSGQIGMGLNHRPIIYT